MAKQSKPKRSPAKKPAASKKVAPSLDKPEAAALQPVGSEAQLVPEPDPMPAPTPAPAPPPVSAGPPPVRRTGRRILIALLGLLLLAGAGTAANYFLNRDTAGDVATRSLVAEVAQRAVLPSGETPTVTTVVDASKANQSFLVNARNGDKVLLYFQAGRAILYRPSTHQIVNMGPLTQPPAKIFLRDGAAGDIPVSLREKFNVSQNLQIVSQDVSQKQNYTETLVIDLNGNRPDLARLVANVVGGKVSSLPEGESRPEADVLVIRGANLK